MFCANVFKCVDTRDCAVLGLSAARSPNNLSGTVIHCKPSLQHIYLFVRDQCWPVSIYRYLDTVSRYFFLLSTPVSRYFLKVSIAGI